MGIKGLTAGLKTIASSSMKFMDYQEVSDMSVRKVYGVDVSAYLYPTQYNRSKKGKGNHIHEFLEMIVTWAAVGIKLIFVFDGDTNIDEKKDTNNSRIEHRIQGQLHIQNIIQEILTGQSVIVNSLHETVIIDKDLHKMGYEILNSNKGTIEQRIALEHALDKHIIVSGDKVDDLVTLFQLVGATYIKAKTEADFVLSALYKHNHIDAVISEDTDMLTHGIEHLIRMRGLRRTNQVMVYTLSDILDRAKLSKNQFIDLCILLGCDYCPKIKNIGIVTGYSLLQTHSNMFNIVNGISEKTLKFDLPLPYNVYIAKYEQAFRMFTREQEPLPIFNALSYNVCDGFHEWILGESDYTSDIIDKNITIIMNLSKITPASEPESDPTLVPAPKGSKPVVNLFVRAPKLSLHIKTKTST
jgi:5'-3' exonuclease